MTVEPRALPSPFDMLMPTDPPRGMGVPPVIRPRGTLPLPPRFRPLSQPFRPQTESVLPRAKRPDGCLLALLAIAAAGVLLYDVANADPEGDGGGPRFAVLVLLGLAMVAAVRLGRRLRRRGGPA